MLEDGLSYPVRGDWVGRILIGGILSLFSVFLIPIFFVNGYLLRVLKGTIQGEDQPPDFTDWGDLFAKGVGVFAIILAYAIGPLLIYGIVISVFFGVSGIFGSGPGRFMAGMGVLSMILLVPVLLFVYYVIPAALTNYAYEGGISAGFDIDAIGEVVFTTEYLIAVLLPIVVAIILWMLSILLTITIVGVLLMPFLQFYGQVAVFRMFGVAFATVSEKVTVDTETAPS